MLHREFEVPRELQDVIKCFWHNKRNEAGGFDILPDGFAEIIFHFGGDLRRNGELLPSPFLMGLLSRPVHFETTGCLEVIAVRCYPWTVFDLLGLPSGKDGLRIFEHPIARLQSEIHPGKVDDAIARLVQYLLGLRLANDATLAQAGKRLRQSNGTIPVAELAAEAHASVRTLERKWKRSSGHTVKDVAGLLRFEQARNRLWTHPGVELASLAQELGYTDQSHLSKEFKRYSGTTPAAFARKTRREQSTEVVAFLQS